MVTPLSGMNLARMINQFAAMVDAAASNGLSSPEFMVSSAVYAGLMTAQKKVLDKGEVLFSNNLATNISEHLSHKFESALEGLSKNTALYKKLSDDFDTTQARTIEDKKDRVTLEHATADAPTSYAQSVVFRTNEYLSVTVATCATVVALYHNSVPIEALNGFAETLNERFPNGYIDDYKNLGTLATTLKLAAPFAYLSKRFGMKLGEVAEVKQEQYEGAKSQTMRNLSQVFSDNESKNDIEWGYSKKNSGLLKAFKFAEYSHFNYMQNVRMGNWYISFIPSLLTTDIVSDGLKSASEVTNQSFGATQGAALVFMDKLANIISLNSSKGDLTVPQRQMNMAAQEIEKAWHAELNEKLGRAPQHEADAPIKTSSTTPPNVPQL
jgi:hypothetical protein